MLRLKSIYFLYPRVLTEIHDIRWFSRSHSPRSGIIANFLGAKTSRIMFCCPERVAARAALQGTPANERPNIISRLDAGRRRLS